MEMELLNTLNDKICIVCGHRVCPICKDFCDETVKQEDGMWEICECFYNDGKCTYMQSEE